MLDGRIAGVWARSTEEAELDLTVWFGTRCHWVLADPTCAIRHEYLPHVGRAADLNRRFPLGPPRRPRDQFAATDSFLGTLDTSSSGPEPAR